MKCPACVQGIFFGYASPEKVLICYTKNCNHEQVKSTQKRRTKVWIGSEE